MYNIEETHCRTIIYAVLQAHIRLMHATVKEALQPTIYGKGHIDTLGLDAIPETSIANSLHVFDRYAILITEEVGTTNMGKSWPSRASFYVSDPTDRSSQLRDFLSSKDESRTVGDVMADKNSLENWEAKFGRPASITGPTSSITCIRYGVPTSCAIVNFITNELLVAFQDGVFCLPLPHYTKLDPAEIKLEYVRKEGKPIFFPGRTNENMDNMRYFVTFLGKSGYEENLRDSDIVRWAERDRFLRYNLPGGATRPYYLSTLQPENEHVGFILANGEKIGEWIHWLPVVRFSTGGANSRQRALRLFEIHQARPWTKEGILMATPPPYSIFADDSHNEEFKVIDINRFRDFPNPSRIRSTLLLTQTTNTWIVPLMEQHLYREICFNDEF
jgi:hypothetical protein